MQLVAAQDVLLRRRRREDHDGDRAQRLVPLDLREHLAAVLARQVEVEQHEVRPRHVDVLALSAPVSHASVLRTLLSSKASRIISVSPGSSSTSSTSIGSIIWGVLMRSPG